MTCPECSSHILDDCLYCPRCGKPTALSAERSVAGLDAAAGPASIPNGLPVFPPAPAAHKARLALSLAAPSLQDARTLNARLTQANLSKVRGNWNEAVDHCVAVLQADPSNAPAHAMLGDIYATRGRQEDAAQWYRMALELHPNPVDEAKLRRVEGEIASREALQARKVQRVSGLPVGLPMDGQAAVGTVALMGVSPRLWLRGITIASLVFLLVSGVILLGTQRRHAQDGSIPLPLGDPNQVNSIAPLPGSEGALPPLHLGGASVVPGGQSSNEVSPPHLGGSGLAPDTNSANRTVPTAFPEARQTDSNAASSPAPPPAANVPTASVRNVRPLEHGSDIPGFATLSGGMKLAKMASLTTSDEAVLVLSNPPVSGDQDNFRQDAIRNVYRAARDAFATNAGAKEASVYIQTDLTEKGGAVLLVAHLDRESALKSNPDADRPESLLNRLRSVQWGH